MSAKNPVFFFGWGGVGPMKFTIDIPNRNIWKGILSPNHHVWYPNSEKINIYIYSLYSV